jgi:hypothetical protein
MKSLRFLIPLLFVLTLLLAATALPAFAQEPTATPAAPAGTPAPTTAPITTTAPVATPAPTGKTYLDPLTPSCDWEGIDAGSPEAFTTKYYRVPYAKNTYLVIYLFMEKRSQLPGFGFDVFDAYNASLFNRPEDDKAVVWDNWAADAAGIGTRANNKLDPWDLEWVGKGNDGTADSFFMVVIHNANPDPVYYNLCYLNKG